MSMWVDKFKPKSTQDIIAQRQNVARIKAWLKTFDASRSKPLFIYGPPGIGKTTAAHLCCKEAGYSIVEFNASDQRNKSIIKDVISTVCGTSRLNFYGRASETKDAVILDEIDGMAGNEDRGGIAQLIIELKYTKKPMIFICNDGQHQKLRSLKDKCENIEFRKPDFESIRTLVSKVAQTENLEIDRINVKNLADSSNYDIRQIINSLSLFKDGDSNQIAKTTRLNAFEATKRALVASKLSIEDRFDCFFSDYNIMPLFIFENYVKNKPAKGDQLKAISHAADSLCLSDLADKEIRTNQNWSLLNAQALLSTVIPSRIVQSYQVGRIDFPQYLGKLSNANKRLRLTQELNAHMCLSVKSGLDADYLDVMRDRLSAPLICKDKLGGIDAVVEFMHEYSMLKDDLNSVMELSTWSFRPDPMQRIDVRTKTALTNAYKKSAVALPYFVDDHKASKKRKPIGVGIESLDADEEIEDEEEQDVKLKPKKVSRKEPPGSQSKKKHAKNEANKESKQVVEEQKKPVARGKFVKGRRSDRNSEPETTVADEKLSSNGKQTMPDKRPPTQDSGIARFFTAKKQRS